MIIVGTIKLLCFGTIGSWVNLARILTDKLKLSWCIHLLWFFMCMNAPIVWLNCKLATLHTFYFVNLVFTKIALSSRIICLLIWFFQQTFKFAYSSFCFVIIKCMICWFSYLHSMFNRFKWSAPLYWTYLYRLRTIKLWIWYFLHILLRITKIGIILVNLWSIYLS